MSEPVYLSTIGLLFGTILLVFGMRYLSAYQQVRARLADDEAYRKIADKAVTNQAEIATALSSIQAALADVKARQAAIEKILKEVE